MPLRRCVISAVVLLGTIGFPATQDETRPSPPAQEHATLVRGRTVRLEHEHGRYALHVPRRNATRILVLLHGSIAEDGSAIEAAETFLRRWTRDADRRGIVLVAPAFDDENFGGHAGPGGGYRGLFGRHVGADVFVNELVDSVRDRIDGLPERILLYGHSAGGQFVSRYLVTHPERIEAAVISAAGTFAFPDPEVAWTNGMKRLQRRMRWSDDEPWEQIDIRPDPEGWLRAAQRPVTVVVGADDTAPIKAIPGNPGTNHIERGRHWVSAMNELARREGRPGRVRFEVVADVGHDSARLTPACRRAFWE